VSTENTVHAKAIQLGKEAFRMTTKSGSGHPSSAISLGHIAVELMYRTMRYDPADPWNPASDRLVLSEGHAVPIIYAAYADLGGTVGNDRSCAVRLTNSDLDSLRELNSTLDGHPNPAEGFPFFDAATGSLGQGLSVAAGLAIAARLDRLDKRIFAIIGDGEAREGQIWEAADFISDHNLTRVCAIFNCNGHGQAAAVSPRQSPEALAEKLAAFGWDVAQVDGHDPRELSTLFDRVGELDKPLAVVARTVKGWGVDSIIGKNYHGKPIPTDDLKGVFAELDSTAKRLGASADTELDHPSPEPARPSGRSDKPITLPPFAEALERVGMSGALKKKRLATRVAYGVGLVALGDISDRIVSLDGDVSNSTFANLFEKAHPDRFFECKIAEQNMVTVASGMSAAGKIPFASTFGKFLARAVDQIDMASISRANVKLVGSHTGVSLGADGPSQMAVSDLAYFRSMTRVDTGNGTAACHVFHPSDPVCAYRCCELMARIDGLCYLRTHRPEAPFLYAVDEQFEVGGSKKLRSGDNLTLVSSGFMVHSVLEVARKLAEQGIDCNVFDAYSFPLKTADILATARESGGTILTAEDNYAGGLHAEMAEAAAEAGEVRVSGMTVKRIPKSAKSADEVFSHVGVGVEQIIENATRLANQGR